MSWALCFLGGSSDICLLGLSTSRAFIYSNGLLHPVMLRAVEMEVMNKKK